MKNTVENGQWTMDSGPATVGRRPSLFPVVLCSLFSVLYALCLPACISDGPPPRAQRPRTPPRQPSNLTAESVVLTVSQFPDDTDADGFADSVQARVHLFSADPRYPLPVAPDGSFRFFILGPDGRAMAQWTFDPAQAAAHRQVSGVGVGYAFVLDLAAAGAEHVQRQDGTLRCEFIPESGAPVSSRGGVTVALGPVR